MNFELVFFIAFIVTGIAWLGDKLYFLPQRRLAGITHRPLWLEYTAGFFTVICIVFAIRSFLVEPYRIPSGSMIPTLKIGDFILVNKLIYGIRLPVINEKVVSISSPKRGDVVVFRYPGDESTVYVKRFIGLPGDEIQYSNKRLTINGEPLRYTADEIYLNQESMHYVSRFTETFPADLGGKKYEILNGPLRLASAVPNLSFPGSEFCKYQLSSLTCKVPPGHYFAMGDNRDNSADSRYWGFVPEKNIVGKAFWVMLATPL